MSHHSKIWSLALVLSLLGLGTSTAWADKAPALVHIEVGGAATPYQVELSLPERGCASSNDTQERWQHDLKVCREGGDAAAPVLSFDILRNEHTPKGTHVQRAHVQSALPHGKRALIVSQRGEGATPLLVTATVR